MNGIGVPATSCWKNLQEFIINGNVELRSLDGLVNITKPGKVDLKPESIPEVRNNRPPTVQIYLLRDI